MHTILGAKRQTDVDDHVPDTTKMVNTVLFRVREEICGPRVGTVATNSKKRETPIPRDPKITGGSVGEKLSLPGASRHFCDNTQRPMPNQPQMRQTQYIRQEHFCREEDPGFVFDGLC